MSLEEYRRKRDPARTPEPVGDRAAVQLPSLRRFVVQRHRASRLHYDLRLEIGGVLSSWAVPRGPSMRPLERRRAARTEDHPLEYLDFEGVIPSGEYGGGDSMVWDHGAWDPELPEDPAAAVEQGELKFDLFGERLRGRFVLVRTGTERGREDWLLIKKADADADERWDIDDHPTSVLTGRTSEEVAKGGSPDGDWRTRTIADLDLSAAHAEATSGFIPPMLATAVDRPFSHPGWLFELKLDGYRIQAHVADGSLRLWTRKRKDGATYFPAFAAAPPDWISSGDAIVDGEMVALDEAGRPDFSLLQELSGTKGLGVRRRERLPGDSAEDSGVGEPAPIGVLVYHAFDLLRLDGLSLLEVPLETRKRLLRLVMRPRPLARYVNHVLEHGEAFQAAVAEQNLEGSLAKSRSSRYEPATRSRSWLKIKARREQELVVIGYEPGQGSHAELGSLLVATFEAGAWVFAGHVGSGIDRRTRAQWRSLIDEHPLPESPAARTPRSATARYCEPRHVIRAEFSEWTADGLLRQASYKGRDLGRDPATVSREIPLPTEDVARGALESTAGAGDEGSAVKARRAQSASVDQAITKVHSASDGPPDRASGAASDRAPGAASDRAPGAPSDRAPGAPSDRASQAELAALDALGGGGRWEVGGHVVTLSNLDKVLFPGAGYTKRDLVRYYTLMAPTILPYLRDRPLNIHRWPDGVTGKTHFWQKQIPAHAPRWVARWDYPDAQSSQSHTYVVADRVATMAWLANQAAIDLHPWTSRLPEYHRPTYALIDIDPGPETTWEQLLTLARLYRTALEHLGVRGHPKVTGKRGIQVWIGLVPRYSFDETRDWVGAVSRSVGAVVPELVSWEWSKSDRRGKARLDYTQNALNKTLVAPYAVRPVPKGAVSAPISWDELDDPELDPQGWDMRAIVERLAQRGDLFAGVLEDLQELPPVT